MGKNEFLHIIAAIIILTAVASFNFIIKKDLETVPKIFLFAVILICVHVISKKLIAYSLDSSVKHSLWSIQRYGYRTVWYFKKPIPAGIILPIFLTIYSIGYLKPMTLLTYQTNALKARAAKRFGYYSFTEITEWHNAIIGAGSILCVLILSFLSYFPG